MVPYLDTLKKEKAIARGNGDLQEKEADPANPVLYKQICEWALESKNMFVWAFAVVHWNVIDRSTNVGSLGFHDFSHKKGEDSIMIHYDKFKKDQKGPKNCCASGMFFALGCYLRLNQNK